MYEPMPVASRTTREGVEALRLEAAQAMGECSPAWRRRCASEDASQGELVIDHLQSDYEGATTDHGKGGNSIIHRPEDRSVSGHGQAVGSTRKVAGEVNEGMSWKGKAINRGSQPHVLPTCHSSEDAGSISQPRGEEQGGTVLPEIQDQGMEEDCKAQGIVTQPQPVVTG